MLTQSVLSMYRYMEEVPCLRLETCLPELVSISGLYMAPLNLVYLPFCIRKTKSRSVLQMTGTTSRLARWRHRDGYPRVMERLSYSFW